MQFDTVCMSYTTLDAISWFLVYLEKQQIAWYLS